MQDDPTQLVAVLSQGELIDVGRYRARKRRCGLRDLSKIKRVGADTDFRGSSSGGDDADQFTTSRITSHGGLLATSNLAGSGLTGSEADYADFGEHGSVTSLVDGIDSLAGDFDSFGDDFDFFATRDSSGLRFGSRQRYRGDGDGDSFSGSDFDSSGGGSRSGSRFGNRSGSRFGAGRSGSRFGSRFGKSGGKDGAGGADGKGGRGGRRGGAGADGDEDSEEARERRRRHEEAKRKKAAMIQMMRELEKEERAKWLESVKGIIKLSKDLSKCLYVQEMELFAKKAIQLILRARTAPWIRTAIVGPRGSGKTTFLAVFLQALAEMLATGSKWKQTFFFLVDFAKMEQNPRELYKWIVKETFEQFSRHNERMEPFQKKMIAYFSGIADGTSAEVFPKRINIDSWIPYIDIKLTKLSQTIKKTLTSGDMEKFIEVAFGFPIEIGKLFGLPEIIFVVDHFEQSDVDVQGRDKLFNISEPVKNVLKRYPFVACCQDEERFLSILDTFDDDGTDLVNRVTFINISEIKIPPEEMRNEILVRFDNGHAAVRLTRDQCAGCVAFLAQWYLLCQAAEEADNFELRQGRHDKKERCDYHARCVDIVRDYLPKVIKTKVPLSSVSTVKFVRAVV